MKTRIKKGAPPNNKKSCKCVIHDTLCDEKPSRLYVVDKSKDYSKVNLKYLREKNLFGPCSKYVCDVCINYAGQKIKNLVSNVEDPEAEPAVEDREPAVEEDDNMNVDVAESVSESVNGENDQIESAAVEEEMDENESGLVDAVDMLISNLEKKDMKIGPLLRSKLDRVVFLLSRTLIAPAIKQHSMSLKGDYNNVEKLQSLDSKRFLNSCSSALLSVIEGCTGKRLEHMFDTKDLFRYAVMVECLYHLRNSNLVLPHCFLLNLIEKTVSGSKSVTAINGKLMPGAGDTTLREWWTGQGLQPLSLPRQPCDLEIWFDNVGKYIVKSYRVKGERNPSPTVVTATQYIILEKMPDQPMLQNSLSKYTVNKKIKDKKKQEKELQRNMLSLRDESVKDFRGYRYLFVKSILNTMLKSSEFEKMISVEIESLKQEHLTRCCDKCGKRFPPRKTKCDACGGHVSSLENSTDTVYGNLNPIPKFLEIGQKCKKNRSEIGGFEPVWRTQTASRQCNLF